MVYFEWDEEKATKNLREHGIDFRDARLVFSDPFRLTEQDSVVDGELRWRTIGTAYDIAILMVVHLEEDDDKDLFVRIISARKATPVEGSVYEENRANDI